MLKLTKQDAAALTLDEMNVGGGEELPQCLKELAGKYFVFQIRVKRFNFTPNHRTFTVFAIVNHINPSTICSRGRWCHLQGWDNANEPYPSGVEGKEGGRKRPRD
ncbi:hypothetical protein DY000_02029942 [Brassica cretica]|uniref:Uncharacterized protein n=1 Tax=Brassica cretica TaxID=69181 RepID=A0ABQ7DGW5_BRACR|nr:hypothetical protein DY000_02029942 [Brassica cretica]